MNYNVGILGGSGFLGSDILKYFTEKKKEIFAPQTKIYSVRGSAGPTVSEWVRYGSCNKSPRSPMVGRMPGSLGPAGSTM